jgi:hypothetical protein
VTTAALRHEQPAAVLDDEGRIWLFFTNDLGERRQLQVQVYADEHWGSPSDVTAGAHLDGSPGAVFWGGRVWLFWDRKCPFAPGQGAQLEYTGTGCWQILARPWAWDVVANAPAPAGDAFLVTRESTGDKEPAPFVDAANRLHVVWRSQRRGRAYQSRSFDTEDPEMLARSGSFEDRAHYTYDTGITNDDWYARDAVGIFLTPDTDAPDVADRNRRLVEGPLRQFLPIHVRPVLFILPVAHRELVYTYEFPEADPQRTIRELYTRETTAVAGEVYSGLGDVYTDSIPEWIWLRTWSPDHTSHHTVDFTATPIDTNYRTWHIGVQPGG